MHRLNPTSSRWLAWSLVILAAGVVVGCGAAKAEVRDPAYVETLRLKITKVRNAVEETRGTIALSRGAPYLPELYVRLAELLSEEARYHYQLAYEREQRSSRVLHVPQVRVLKEQSISTYKMVLKRFPETPLGARVLFNVGHEHRELGNFEDMLAVLQQLVADYPNSPLKYDALLVLGDYHFDRSQLTEAGNYYRQIADAKLHRLSGLGNYKLAWVYVNEGECKPALEHFESAITMTEQWEKLRQDALAQGGSATAEQGLTEVDIDVRRESLVDGAFCFSRERKAKTAVPYFRKMAYNRATYLSALDRLANRYRVMDQAEGAMAATRELLRLGPASADRLDDARTLYAAIKKRKRFDELDADMALIAGALTRHYSRVDVDDEERSRIAEEFELYVRDLATSAQPKVEALSEELRPEAAMRLAAGYQVYVDTFPNAAQLPDMLLNMTDVLDWAGQDLEAGLRSHQAAQRLEDPTAKADALYDAVVHFQTSLDRESDRAGYERVTARAFLRAAAEELLSFQLDAERSRRVKFAIAQAYYDEGRYLEAIDKLSAVAYEYPSTAEADASLQLVLDSYNTTNDYDGLMYTGRRLLAADSPASDKLRAELQPIVVGAEQRKLDELSLTAAGEDGGDISVLEEFAVQNTGTDLGERALLNAFVAARATGDSDKMYQLADQIAKTYPASDQLPGVYATIAQAAVARFEYDLAVDYMRRAAQVNEDQRTRLLVAAAGLMEQLGDVSAAENLYREAVRSAAGPARAEPLATYSELLERLSDPNRVVKELSPYINEGDSDVLARLGLAQVALGRVEEAETTLQTALGGASSTAEAEARAQYGIAEVLFGTLKSYPTPNDIDLLQEYITLIEVVEEGYLNAARLGSPEFTAAALSRLAFSARFSAEKLGAVPMPASLGPAEQEQVRAALAMRIETLNATATQALEACAQQAWSNRVFNPIVRQCLLGQPHSEVLVRFDMLKPRQGASTPSSVTELRSDLSKNPENVDALRRLGEAFLDGRDPHAARLVFAKAVQAGGGAPVQNLLGIASYRAGDIGGAFEAFTGAAEGGSEAARQNLVTLLKENGLAQIADQALERFPAGTPGDRLLNQ